MPFSLRRFFSAPFLATLRFALLLLLLATLSLRAWSAYETSEESQSYLRSPSQLVLVLLFVLFTLDAVAKIVLSGFIRNSSPPAPPPPLPDTPAPSLPKFPSHCHLASSSGPPILPSALSSPSPPHHSSPGVAHSQAYLRSSWNRIDFIAIVAFWTGFALRTLDPHHFLQNNHIHVFNCLSSLKLIRLLTISSGNATILNSLKRASPLLVNVVFFIFFAVALFSVVGIQSFKGSFDRHCVYIDPLGIANYTFTSQSCGGYYHNISGLAQGFIQRSTGLNFRSPKGYICPQGQLCLETGNPNNGTQNFDNMAGAVLQVLIIASANTWSNMMYSLMDSEYFASCLFFIVCLLILNFWLLNILVAVITNTFGEIMYETKSSAFSNSGVLLNRDDQPPTPPVHQSSHSNLTLLHPSELTLGWSRAEPSSSSIGPFWDRFGPFRYTYAWQRVLDRQLHQKFLKKLWILAVLVDFSFQASRLSASRNGWGKTLDQIEMIFTLLFILEIIQRVSVYMPRQVSKFVVLIKSARRPADYEIQFSNSIDLFLAVITAVIQLPFIKKRNPKVYLGLTVFQICRFYRVIVAFPRIGKLLKKLRGSVVGLMNMIIFLLMMNFFAALVASQLLRGVIPAQGGVEMTFFSLWNSFLAMYQVFSSENWTTVLYSAMAAQATNNQAFISGALITCWFLFANFVLLQMFIAVISEGFAVAEEQKRREQVRILIDRVGGVNGRHAKWFSNLNPYHHLHLRQQKKKFVDRYGNQGSACNNLTISTSMGSGKRPSMENWAHGAGGVSLLNKDDPNGGSSIQLLDLRSHHHHPHTYPMSASGSSSTSPFILKKSSTTTTLDADDLPSQEVFGGQKSRVRQFLKLDSEGDDHSGDDYYYYLDQSSGHRVHRKNYHSSFVSRARKAFLLDSQHGPFAGAGLADKNLSSAERMKAEEDKQAAFLNMTPSERQQYYMHRHDELRLRESEFIKAHPTYDRVFWFIPQNNPVRKFCQLLVEPAYGQRVFGLEPNRMGVFVFKLMVFLAILGGVVVAAIATPVYKQHYYQIHGQSLMTWFTLSEMVLGLFFILEFIIKVLADGLVFTPNAYFLNTWNRIDFFVLVTLVTDIVAWSAYGGSTSRLSRSLKAFRVLRLINLNQSIRETFYNVLILGFGDLLDASLLTVMYIVPFAVWGQNMFAGLLYSCNDSGVGIKNKFDCVGEFVSGPVGMEGVPDSFTFLMPRTWANPEYSFDSFRAALLILFEIISLEGWIDVMTSLMSITGKDLQPTQDASQLNAIFSLVYNLFGATVILSLFLAVIINNFLKRSGSAFLTTEQQQWINLRKLMKRQEPSKRPRKVPRDGLRGWCYRQVIQKHGPWSRMMTGLYLVHVVLLTTLARANLNTKLNVYRDFMFLGLGMIYSLDLMVRLVGLGLTSFQQNGWNVFDTITIVGTLSTTITILRASSRSIFSGSSSLEMVNGSNLNSTMIQFQKVFLVGIGFKLVSKDARLNGLFKVAISSLKSIGDLLGLWLILFLVWSILFVENLSLTKVGQSALSSKSNYQSVVNALVMLAIQSTGEGWNTFMHDYTVEAPFCVDSPNFLFNDCGSLVGSYVLFISWNVASMYIILNMFTGLVVDNFAYVFQSGNVKSIDREEIRKFKEAWSEVDVQRRGYLEIDQVVRFFSRLSGAFEVRVYPKQLEVKELVRCCVKEKKPSTSTTTRTTSTTNNTSSDSNSSWSSSAEESDSSKMMVKKSTKKSNRRSDAHLDPSKSHRKGEDSLSEGKSLVVDGIEVAELRRRIFSPSGSSSGCSGGSSSGAVDWDEIQRRKVVFNMLYQEAKIIIKQSNTAGISFSEMMLLLAQYKLIVDDQAMKLEEFLERKEQKEKAMEMIKFEKIEGVLKMVVERRRFKSFLKRSGGSRSGKSGDRCGGNNGSGKRGNGWMSV